MIWILLVVSGLFLLEWNYRRVTRKFFGAEAFPTIYADFERLPVRKLNTRLVIRFKASTFWFVVEHLDGYPPSHMRMCFPRVGFSADDYSCLQMSFEEQGFYVRMHSEESRFFASILTKPKYVGDTGVTAIVRATSVFMRSLDMDDSQQFRRDFEADI